MATDIRTRTVSILKPAGVLFLIGILAGAAPAAAVDFLGATLCRDHATATITIPEDSGLRLASVEIGDENGLLMLLYATGGDVLEHLDALMTRITGHPGEREGDSVQWSGQSILAYASLVKKGTVAMAVSSNDDCEHTPPNAQPAPEAPAMPTASAPERPVIAEGTPAVTSPRPPSTEQAPALDTEQDFRLHGELKFEAASPPWVDVMGIIENLSSKAYKLAAFDLSLYDGQEKLICVDTISVGMLKPGQSRAFRDSLSCPDYLPGGVKSYRLQFSGGY